ncbi:hypothetical protein X975_03763, partial [Stegodyphus mimosarum]
FIFRTRKASLLNTHPCFAYISQRSFKPYVQGTDVLFGILSLGWHLIMDLEMGLIIHCLY